MCHELEEEEESKSKYLEVDVGAEREDTSELRIAEDVLPLSGSMLPDAGEQRILLILRPFALLFSHLSSSSSFLPSSLRHQLLALCYPLQTLNRFRLPETKNRRLFPRRPCSPKLLPQRLFPN